MEKTGRSFNLCSHCGQVMHVIKTKKFDECRIRTYECRECKTRRRSVERFRPQPEGVTR